MAISNKEIKEAAKKYVGYMGQGKESNVCYDLIKDYVRVNYSYEIKDFIDTHYQGNGFEDVLEEIMEEIKKQVHIIISQTHVQHKEIEKR